MPIFNGFVVTSRARESIALEGKERNDLETTRRNAALGARQAFLGVNSGLAQVKTLEEAEVSSQSAPDSNKLGYQGGVRINIDVLNAQRQLYSSRRDLSRARHEAPNLCVEYALFCWHTAIAAGRSWRIRANIRVRNLVMACETDTGRFCASTI